MQRSPLLSPPRAVGPALPAGLAWTLLPWRRWRRSALGVAVLAGALGWLQLAEPQAEALPFARGGVSLPAPVPPAEAGLDAPDAIVAGAELLLPGLDLSGGEASYYASGFEGRPTASGEPYRGKALTAAHRTLPFGTRVKVTNLANGRSVEVRINDRGPFHRRRVIDLSRAAAERLGMVRRGRAPVEVQVLAAAGR